MPAKRDPRLRPRVLPWAIAVVVALIVAACNATTRSAPNPPPAAGQDVRVGVVAAGLEHVWDMGFLPDGRVLVTERDGRFAMLSSSRPGAAVTPVTADLGDVHATGEGGLMGMVLHPDFASSRRFTTCQTHWENGAAVDVRLVTWELAADGGSAAKIRDPLVGGLPIATSGRHSGCRPTIGPDGALLVGTGDTARGNLSQDLTSLGGKVLRIDLATGGPAPGNPFATAADPAQRLIWSFGHRNVQGVAVQPGTGRVYTAEHGPSTDDEVNVLRAGGNYGWDPSQGGTEGGYDESVPMTDTTRFPDAVRAVWSSGSPVEAGSGAGFVSGSQWGARDGALALAALRGQKLLLMTFNPDGSVANVTTPAALDGPFGRLRAVRPGPDGALFVSTSNGSDDKVLRIEP